MQKSVIVRRPVVLEIVSCPLVVTLGVIDGQARCWVGSERVNLDVAQQVLLCKKDSEVKPQASDADHDIVGHDIVDGRAFLTNQRRLLLNKWDGIANREYDRSRGPRLRARVRMGEQEARAKGVHGKFGQYNGNKPLYKGRGREAIRYQTVAGLTMVAAILSGMAVNRKWAEDDARLERRLRKLERREGKYAETSALRRAA